MQQPGQKRKIKTLIHLSSLPPEQQVAYFHRYIEPQTENLSGWEYLPQGARQIAMQRLEIVQRARDILVRSDYGNRQQKIAALADESGISLRTLYNYVNLYEDGRLDESTGELITGLIALVPAHGKNRGRHHSITQPMQDFIRGIWLKPHRPSASYVYYQLSSWCKEQKIAAPTKRTVFRYLAEIPASVITTYRSGHKDYTDTFEPVIRRDISMLEPNELWVGDHREHDVFIYVSENRVQAKRVWMTAWWDLASAKLVGCCWNFAPSSRTIAIAFRNGVTSHGVPKGIYIDNGKDYRSHMISGASRQLGSIDIDSETMGIMKVLKVDVTHAIPYSARSKPIERWFRLWSEGFDPYLPGWCGRNNKQRPEKLAGEISGKSLLTMLEFKEMAQQYRAKLDAIPYGSRQKAPLVYYEGLKIATVEPHILDLLLMERKRVKVNSYGIQAFNGLYYRSDELMRNVLVGQYVTIRWDPDDLSSIVVWREDGRLVGRVGLERAAEMSAKGIDIDAVKAVQRYRKAQRELIASYRPTQEYQDDFQKALATVRQQREAREKDREKPQQNPAVIPTELRFFPQSLQQTAAEVRDASVPDETTSENVIPLFFKKAAGDDADPAEEKYEPKF